MGRIEDGGERCRHLNIQKCARNDVSMWFIRETVRTTQDVDVIFSIILLNHWMLCTGKRSKFCTTMSRRSPRMSLDADTDFRNRMIPSAISSDRYATPFLTRAFWATSTYIPRVHAEKCIDTTPLPVPIPFFDGAVVDVGDKDEEE